MKNIVNLRQGFVAFCSLTSLCGEANQFIAKFYNNQLRNVRYSRAEVS